MRSHRLLRLSLSLLLNDEMATQRMTETTALKEL